MNPPNPQRAQFRSCSFGGRHVLGVQARTMETAPRRRRTAPVEQKSGTLETWPVEVVDSLGRKVTVARLPRSHRVACAVEHRNSFRRRCRPSGGRPDLV